MATRTAKRQRPPGPLPSEATAAARRLALSKLGLLDTAPEPEFDDLTQLASSICGTPIALVSLLDHDRQWFKSRLGLDVAQTPLRDSFCAHAVGAPSAVMVVEDAAADERFRENPLVTGHPDIRAYAGMPILDPQGTPLGTICVIDREARGFTDAQREALRTLARQITAQLELRTRIRQLQTIRQTLTASNEQLDQFAYIMAHDLLAPIRHQTSFAELLEADYGPQLPTGARKFLGDISRAGGRASALISDISAYVHAAKHGRARYEHVEVGAVVFEALEVTPLPPGVHFSLQGAAEVMIEVNRAALSHILQNLLSNAAKFVDPDGGRVAVRILEDLDTIHVEVADDGIGMSPETRHAVFELFNRGANVGERAGRGLGLSIARKLALGLCGELTVSSEGEGRGTTFRLTLPREDWYGVDR